ncbi:Ig-like domain-containing protein [Sodalis ligni]|uniref:Ig-like domain-containing protein n=1 Tax=Sodalis ligni TaxID=2697027 RepID=UPI00193FE706|nr:Ig-like domain-containing protein [Sodalis ligni]QWA11381.1 Ig-like domain-containing protein [Sodalis ligni]
MQNQCSSHHIPKRDYHLALTSSATAKADGRDKNNAVATLYRFGLPLCGSLVTFWLSGNAAFCDDSKQTSAITDNRGQAIVYFTDCQQETVAVTCQFDGISAVSYSTFESPDEITGLGIIANVETNYAPANDFASNIIQYTLWDFTTEQPVPGRVLSYSIVRGMGGLYNTFDTTNDAGLARVSLRSGTPASVEVKAILDGQPTVYNYTVVSFTSPITHTISAEPLDINVPVGGIYRIRYTLRDIDGNVVPGALMTFIANPTQAAVNPEIALTNTQGQITVSITSPVVLSVIITAEYALGNATNTTLVTFI